MWQRDRRIVLALAAALISVSCARNETPKNAFADPTPIAVRSQTLTISQVPVRDTFSGVVRARLNAALSAKVVGRILEVDAREGDQVRQGQVLLKIDPREQRANEAAAIAGMSSASSDLATARLTADMQARADRARIAEALSRLDAAKAGLRTAQARLDLVVAGPRAEDREQANQLVLAAQSQQSLAASDLARGTTLFNAGAISRQQLDHLQSAYEVAKTSYESALQAQKAMLKGSRPEEIKSAAGARNQAQAEVTQAEASLTEAKALATQTTVQRQQIARAMALHAQASANLTGTRTSLSETEIRAPFDGVVTARIADPGSMASPGTNLLSIASKDLRLEVSVPESKLASIRMGMDAEIQIGENPSAARGTVAEIVPEGDPSAHTFTVKVSLPRGFLKPGMYGKAAFQVGTRRGLFIPEAAIVWRDGLPYAYAVGADHTASFRVLTLGDTFGSRYEVLSGLSPGERFVMNPPPKLTDGAAVTEAGASP